LRNFCLCIATSCSCRGLQPGYLVSRLHKNPYHTGRSLRHAEDFQSNTMKSIQNPLTNPWLRDFPTAVHHFYQKYKLLMNINLFMLNPLSLQVEALQQYYLALCPYIRTYNLQAVLCGIPKTCNRNYEKHTKTTQSQTTQLLLSSTKSQDFISIICIKKF
jgi:hypothetical protein